MKKVGFVSLGCPKNLVDSEIMLGLLKEKGFDITNNKDDAQVLVVNTCGFIESAKQESINTIIEMSKCKEDKCELVIVTGCLAERYNEEIVKEIPEVDAVLGTGDYGKIVEAIENCYKNRSLKPVYYGNVDVISYLDSDRVLSNTNGFNYLKIAEGCDNHCTYCIIPSLRGKYRSRLIEKIVEEANMLAENGCKEIILVAQDTTRYGVDIYKQKMLVELIRKLSSIKNIEWIRLLYCYPEEIDDELINEIKSNNKVCKYIDIPIQHASNNVLKLMGRRGTKEDICKLIYKLRREIPQIVIRTSLIVGFPGESEEDFNELKEIVSTLKFEKLGVFTYSREEDTAAAEFENQIDERTKKRRLDQIMKLQNQIQSTKNKERINKIYKTLVEGVAEDGIFYTGRTYAEAPDIDGIIYFTSPEPLEFGQYVNVKILNIDQYDLVGEVIYESCK